MEALHSHCFIAFIACRASLYNFDPSDWTFSVTGAVCRLVPQEQSEGRGVNPHLGKGCLTQKNSGLSYHLSRQA